jgi:hypothetical protein
MPEGLDPIEAGRKLHEHTHPEEPEGSRRAAQDEKDKRDERHSRILQSGEAILLALVTIAAAWAGYAAAKWGTESRVQIAQSSTLRNLATREDLEALTTRNFDSSTFEAWFTAYALGNKQAEAVAIRRFRPAFRVAFNAWITRRPPSSTRATTPRRSATTTSGSPCSWPRCYSWSASAARSSCTRSGTR